MTIGFDASRAFIENRTGTENYSFQLLKASAKIDTENCYLIYLRKGQAERVKGEEWPENFQFRVINFKYLWTQVGLAIKTFTDPLDVLFVPSHTLPLLRKPGLKTVITVHDLGSEYLPAFHQLKQVLYLKLMTHYQLRGASKIIAVSEATKKDLIKKAGIKSGKIAVVYEGVGDEFKVQSSKFIIDTQKSILKHYGLEKMKYFLFVGTIQPRKNLERLIRSFAEFLKWEVGSGSSEMGDGKWEDRENKELKKNFNSDQKNLTSTFKKAISNIPSLTSKIQLVLVGKKGWKSESIYNLPKELNIEEKILFPGRVSEEDLAALYKGAIALTYPSLFEGFGLPILEAFASGCPVVTSNTSSIPEVAGEAALLVNPESEKEIIEAMVKITKDDKFRDNLIQKGYIRIESFSWEKCARETVQLFEKLA